MDNNNKHQYVPKLYETERIPLEKKIIYQKWDLEHVNFYWLIAELDKKENLAFGYANLNDNLCAEWGYINMQEIIDNGAEPDRSWTPCTFDEAQQRINKFGKTLNYRKNSA